MRKAGSAVRHACSFGDRLSLETVEVAAAMAQTAATAVLQLAIVYSQIIVSGDEFFEAAICDLASAFTGKVDMGRVCDDGRVVNQGRGDGVVVDGLGRGRCG